MDHHPPAERSEFDERSRYLAVSRRSFLRSTALAGVGGLLVAACGTGDATILEGQAATAATDSTNSSVAPNTTATSSATSTETSSAVADSTTSTTAGTEAAEADSSAGLALPDTAEMVVDFTYEKDSTGKNLSPYIAVWVEDADGNLVRTIELWFEQSRKGDRWLPDLKRWYTVDQRRVDAGGDNTVDLISSATRLPGAYSVVWDGSTDAAVPAPAGQYFVCIESARERGPYSLIREPVTLNGSQLDLVLPDAGELVSASVSVA